MHFPLRPLAAALAALCTTSLVFADTALAPVSVTAKGYESDTLSTPSSVFVGDGDTLRKNGANNLGEALRGEVGFASTNDGAQGQNPVIRGIKKEGIVLLVDGMRFNSAQPQGAIASFMSLGLADRVEAVKGPASVLYGTGAVGGAINVLLPQARFEPGAKATLGASYDSASQGFRGTGVANLSQGDHALMVGTSIARIDDYKAPDGKVDRTGYDSDAFIGQYRFRIDGQNQLRLSLQQQKDEDVWYPGSTKRFSHPNAAVAAAVQSTTIHSPKQDRTLAEIGYSHKGSGEAPLNVDVRAYRQEMERRIYAWSNALNRDITMTKVGFETNGFDAKADWLVHPQHLLSFGMNLWEMGASPERTIANPPNSLNYVRSDPFDDGRIKAAGILSAGRHALRQAQPARRRPLRQGFKGSADSVANSANPLGARRTTGLDRDDSAFSGSLGASYEIDPLLRPYASLSRGFRAGEMRERYESSPRGDGYYYVGDPQIRPEISTQLELGLKGRTTNLPGRRRSSATRSATTCPARTSPARPRHDTLRRCQRWCLQGNSEHQQGRHRRLRGAGQVAGLAGPLAEGRPDPPARRERGTRRAAVPDAGRRTLARLGRPCRSGLDGRRHRPLRARAESRRHHLLARQRKQDCRLRHRRPWCHVQAEQAAQLPRGDQEPLRSEVPRSA
jgi:hemoglobin/transferrin/lactoferrin receptor protein